MIPRMLSAVDRESGLGKWDHTDSGGVQALVQGQSMGWCFEELYHNMDDGNISIS